MKKRKRTEQRKKFSTRVRLMYKYASGGKSWALIRSFFQLCSGELVVRRSSTERRKNSIDKEGTILGGFRIRGLSRDRVDEGDDRFYEG